MVIAIDGYSGCGKSTTAKLVANEFGFRYIDTGAMYRATTLYFMRNYVRLTNEKDVESALKYINVDLIYNDKFQRTETYLNGLRVENEIRTMEVSSRVSEVAAIAAVRHAMVALQQKMGAKGQVVMDGRDIGTTVFPKADFKFFMSANTQTRAERRQKDMLERGEVVDLKDIIFNLEERDRIDSGRKESPLRKADDAHDLNTSNLTIDSQVQYIVRMIKEASKLK
jgi:cytidylate kinase